MEETVEGPAILHVTQTPVTAPEKPTTFSPFSQNIFLNLKKKNCSPRSRSKEAPEVFSYSILQAPGKKEIKNLIESILKPSWARAQ